MILHLCFDHSGDAPCTFVVYVLCVVKKSASSTAWLVPPLLASERHNEVLHVDFFSVFVLWHMLWIKPLRYAWAEHSDCKQNEQTHWCVYRCIFESTPLSRSPCVQHLETRSGGTRHDDEHDNPFTKTCKTNKPQRWKVNSPIGRNTGAKFLRNSK